MILALIIFFNESDSVCMQRWFIVLKLLYVGNIMKHTGSDSNSWMCPWMPPHQLLGEAAAAVFTISSCTLLEAILLK